MGAPEFVVRRDLTATHDIHFSSNMRWYGDLSHI